MDEFIEVLDTCEDSSTENNSPMISTKNKIQLSSSVTIAMTKITLDEKVRK